MQIFVIGKITKHKNFFCIEKATDAYASVAFGVYWVIEGIYL